MHVLAQGRAHTAEYAGIVGFYLPYVAQLTWLKAECGGTAGATPCAALRALALQRVVAPGPL